MTANPRPWRHTWTADRDGRAWACSRCGLRRTPRKGRHAFQRWTYVDLAGHVSEYAPTCHLCAEHQARTAAQPALPGVR